MPFDLDTLSATVMAAPPSEATPLPDLPDFTADAAPAQLGEPIAPVVDSMSLSEFKAGWGMVHHLLGHGLSSRIGAPVDLGSAAMNETGQEACKAAYDLAKEHAPFLLDKRNSTFSKIAAIAAHGFVCVQMIQQARMGQTVDQPPNPQFSSTRGQET